ncbi:MAG: TIGR03960 family B12-binding radical SAM protein, partial [Clostridia bacterium]|nr:TIGR03960 family B12-binding radical SAM protein [Clostridia bacterium]
CYTNVLNMLDLAGIPILSKDRKKLNQIVVAGGPCAYNPEPLADFVDIFLIGEGEEEIVEMVNVYKKAKKESKSKEEFLKEVSKIEGVYIPAFYDVEYNEDLTIKEIRKNKEFAPDKVKKRIIRDFDKVYYPESFVVPSIEIIHDRAVEEVLRGCIRGCRFCQAGFIYRPTREKSIETIKQQCNSICKTSGYDEISLSSLSTTDYSKIEELLKELSGWGEGEKINISLPSLRVDGFSGEILKNVKKMRKGSLTFAPEAGSQRLRNVINKNVTKEELLKTCKIAFDGGFQNIKLYFMIGLPTENDDDIKQIAQLAQSVVDLYYSNENRVKGKSVKITISVASFIPKPFTPFQWEAQATMQELERKQLLLKSVIKSKKINYNYHSADTALIEAVFARGDRRLCKVLYEGFKRGFKFDSWSEFFSLDKWLGLFSDCGIDPGFYANRKRNTDEILPWDIIDCGVNKEFFVKELNRAYDEKTTENCKEKCSNCGANCFKGGICYERR